ncbi:UNVERIFIED_CONTAM: hypothetical protein Sindi_2984500 [Sesamum indicum]
MEASRAAGDGLHPRPSAPGGTHTGGCLRGVWALGAGRGKAAPPQPPSLGRPHGLGVACVGLVLAARVRRGTPVGRLSGGLRCCVRPMPICIVCAECLPVRNGKPSGACFDCDLLKHGQHKPRPSKGWSVGPLMLVGLPPHKRTDAGAVGIRRSGCLSPLVACDAEISSLWWAKCRQSRFWVRLLVARCLRTWRRQGRPATACTPDRRLPVAPTQGGCGRRRRLLPATPRSVARGWRSVGNPGMQGSRTGAGVCFWVRLLVARRLRKWRRRTGKSVRSLGFCSSVPNSCFVPNLRAYRGMLGRACCRSPAATLECVVGRRALACLLGHCVRNGRVSGDWRVWACWIPARAATTSPASRFSRRPKRAPALAAVGFLCCIPIAKAFHCPERPVFALRCTPRGRGAGWTSRRPLCPTSRARPHVPGSLAHCVVARSLGCGTHGGYEASASVCPESKRSALRANDARHRFGLVPCGRRGRYSLFDGTCYSDNRSNSRANTCNKPRLLEGMHLLDKRSTRAPPVAAMIHDNSTDRTALVPATHHSNFCPINFRWVRFRRGSLRNGYHIQGRQQARKLPNPDTGRIHWRASLVPAAAVIPAPIAWTLGWAGRSASGVHRSSRPFCRRCAPGLNWPGRASGAVTLKKLECSKQAYALYTLAWDNIIGFRSYYVGLRDRKRKLGARRRSDTVLVSTINDADQGSRMLLLGLRRHLMRNQSLWVPGGSMVARLKLKELTEVWGAGHSGGAFRQFL